MLGFRIHTSISFLIAAERNKTKFALQFYNENRFKTDIKLIFLIQNSVESCNFLQFIKISVSQIFFCWYFLVYI